MSFADIALRALGVVLLVGAALFLVIKLEWAGAGRRQAPSAEYMARARALAQAVDIAGAVRATVQGESQEDALAFERLLVKDKALTPEPPFASLESLAYLEDAFFTYWNEASGEHIERFWQLVAERGLPFQRRDVVREVLNRGRIKDDIEYQHVTDGVVILRQSGRISREEADRLSMMLKQFEESGGKRQ
jgi:hypothetical protein